MEDLEKTANNTITLPKKNWIELQQIADSWGVPRSMAVRLIFNDWKKCRSVEAGENVHIPKPQTIDPKPQTITDPIAVAA